MTEISFDDADREKSDEGNCFSDFAIFLLSIKFFLEKMSFKCKARKFHFQRYKKFFQSRFSYFSSSESFLLKYTFFYKKSIFDPRPENCLSFSKKSHPKIV